MTACLCVAGERGCHSGTCDRGGPSIEFPSTRPTATAAQWSKDPWGNTWQIANPQVNAEMTADPRMAQKTVTVTIHIAKVQCVFIPVDFDPKAAAASGKIRAPVKVTFERWLHLPQQSYQTSMCGVTFTGEGNREAAMTNGGENIAVTIELDTNQEKSNCPNDLRAELRANKQRLKKWCSLLSYTNRRAEVEAIEKCQKASHRARRYAIRPMMGRPLRAPRYTARINAFTGFTAKKRGSPMAPLYLARGSSARSLLYAKFVLAD